MLALHYAACIISSRVRKWFPDKEGEIVEYYICIETGVVLTKQQWVDGCYSFSKLALAELVDGKWDAAGIK